GLHALVGALPEQQLNSLPFLKSLQIDTRILAFSFLLSALTGIVFGSVPALQSSRLDLNETLKEGGRTMAGGARHRLRSVFVASEIALAVVLLVGGGWRMKSLFRLLQTNGGFNPTNVLTIAVVLPPDPQYNQPPALNNFHDQLTERLQSIPGVASVGTIDILPLQGGNTTRFYVEGDPVPAPGQAIEANMRVPDEGYFQTLGIPLIAGRYFDSRDTPNAPGVVIIGKSVADRVFAGRDPIGRRIKYASFDTPGDLIVGVVGDVKISGLDEETRPVLYYPFRQLASPFTTVVVKSNTEPTSVAGAVREQMRGLEPNVAIFNVLPMDEVVSTSPAAFMRRFPGLLITIFATVALLLASIGIYGVVSYS